MVLCHAKNTQLDFQCAKKMSFNKLDQVAACSVENNNNVAPMCGI